MFSVGLAAFPDIGPTVMRRLRRLGYLGVDLQCDSDLPYMVGFDVAKFAESVGGAGMQVVCVSNVHDVELLCVRSTSDQEAAARAARQALKLARALDVDLVRLYFGCPDLGAMFYRHLNRMEWAQIVRETAMRAIPIVRDAAALGINVIVEPHPRQSLFTLDDLDLFNSILDREGLAVGVAFDPANLMAGGLDPIEYLAAMGPPDVVHLKDAEVRAGPRRPTGPGWRRYGPGPFVRFRQLGEGSVQWAAVAARLEQTSFRGPLVLEFEDPLTTASTASGSVLRAAEATFRFVGGAC